MKIPKEALKKALPKELQKVANVKLKATETAIKAKIALYVVPVLIIYFGVFILIAVFGGADFNTQNQGLQKQEGFRDALYNSIKSSGKLQNVYFTEILTAYMLTVKKPEKYDSTTFEKLIEAIKTGKKPIDLVKKSEYKPLYALYDASYRGLVEGNNIKWYFPVPKEIQTPSPVSTPLTTPKETPQPTVTPIEITPTPQIQVKYTYSDDFLNPRDYANIDVHYGCDIVMQEGTPIIAIEGGTIENIGWNNAGGWRIGIRSQDKKRYWYYAHMRKLNPYKSGLVEGSIVQAGELIGYCGSSGYSPAVPPNAMPPHPAAVDGKFISHLHLGLQVKRNDKEKEEWVNVYPIIRFLDGLSQTTVKEAQPDYISNIPSVLIPE